MIHVVEEKKLNDFKETRCVRPRDLFARYGKRESPISFDSSEEVVPIGMNKIESIEYLERYDRMMQSAHRPNGDGTEAPSQGKQSVPDGEKDPE